MARTRGAKSSSPSTRLRIPRDTPVQDSTSELPRPRLVPPPVQDAPTSPPPRRYNTRRSLTITESSSEPESEPTPSPPPAKKSPPPAKKPQPSQTPARESQIPSGMTPEVAIRCPMVIQPPIEGNLDCRARPFHSELYFDIATFRIQPELKESFRLLQRVTSFILCPEGHLTPLHPEEGASPSMFFIDALLRHNIFPLQHWVQRRGVLLEHCIGSLRDTSLALTISSWLLFYTLKRRCIERSCSERMPFHSSFPDYYAIYWSTCDTQQSLSMSVDIFVERFSLSTNGPATPQPPPVIPPISESSPSVEPRIAIPIIEYRGLCHTFQALATSQSILTQQMTALCAH
ncbi:hypothetical protein CK203_077787 [Vitis vinifera]|uniref:Uncharacterized protein n=1 Tax=Vitis vinifera TaxID=29760 RepID=A0A438EWN9_VITVI|nr:hypothetical protein CK203_077787 [Vitis vinifera]